jgi:hypothetical protein
LTKNEVLVADSKVKQIVDDLLHTCDHNSEYWSHIRSHPGHENDSPTPPRKPFENRERYSRSSYGRDSNSRRRSNY